MHGHYLLLLFVVAACCPTPPAKAPVVVAPPGTGTGSGSGGGPPPGEATLESLTEGAKVHGFTAVALYLDAADKPFGARFIHDKTGFTYDYLRIESAPQGFIWVHSFPTSDKGEPHTQEHLLLGKGDRGRKLGSEEAMALAQSSAFTAQWRTCYHFNTVAGNDEFWPVFQGQLDALINPDYTDEEIKREVRNFGIDKGDDGKLHLEEKGTVYNEMVRTYEQPEVGLWRTAGQLVYGAKHPLALDSGGYPDAIRTMTPADIRRFHDANYHLANMGMVGAYPSTMSLASVLDHTSAILDHEAGRTGKVTTEAALPRPAPAAAGTIQVVDYPYSDTANPGPMMLAWPASRELDETDRVLLGLFLDAFAGDESTTLYKKLIDSKTRAIDLGATSVFSMVSTDQGHPVYMVISGVKPDRLDEPAIADVRKLVASELEAIAKLPDGDPALIAFDQRVQSRVVDLRRRLAKFLDTPPGFGTRGIGAEWIEHLHQLDKTKGFHKSVTLKPALAQVEQLLAAPANPWRDRLHAWGLLDQPFGIAARPSPARRAQLDNERKQRNEDEAARLQKAYATPDLAATLARYQQDYDAATRKLEDSAKAVELPPLVATPPMTLDDGLQYTTGEIGDVRTFTATFDSMASSRVQLAFDVREAVAPDNQMFLAGLPSLLTDAGMIDEQGKPIAADEVREQVRKQILELSAYYVDNPRTGRVELVIAGAGNNPDETKAALTWMRRAALSPDWRIDNLPRLRDVVDQEITGMRQRMLGAEEAWVDDPRDAWWLQKELEYVHTRSFLTQAHDLHRLRWMLADPRDAKVTAEVTAFLGKLGEAKTLPRADLIELAKVLAAPTAKAAPAKLSRWIVAAGTLSDKAKPLAVAAGKDLSALLGDLPDASLAADWAYLCKQMAHDLKLGAPAALAKLDEVRKDVIQAARARIVQVGATSSITAIGGAVDGFAHALPAGARTKATSPRDMRFAARLAQHDPGAKAVFVGLVDPATSSGVFLNLAKSTGYTDTKDDAVLEYLASNLYTGHGGHSIFMKTWAAGLAYSNGLHPRVGAGVLDYYAERCPLLPQTLRFVIDQLKKAKPDPNIARYAIATAFTSRIANPYEQRASAMASDLVDEQPPDLVRAFRTKLLEAAKRGDLDTALYGRMESVYGKVLPGYGKLDPDGVYFVIGPEKQLAAYQEYLHAAIGKDTKLFRLYPRDFWVPASI